MNRKNKGFTLVEILIVVIILGILAAIVIPQFTEASNDARKSALQSDLQTMRSQLELYKVQHLDNYPDVDTPAEFVDQMTKTTNQAGGDVGTGTLGPYLQKVPTNPFVSGDIADDVMVGIGDTTSPGDETTGWFYNKDTGLFAPNTADHKDW